MSALHAYFHLHNQQVFQRLLDGGSHGQLPVSSSSGGRSWSRPSPLSAAAQCDVNARDQLGHTDLHLAAAAQNVSAPEYVRLLLAHPDININALNKEDHWTPLHSKSMQAKLVSLENGEITDTLKSMPASAPQSTPAPTEITSTPAPTEAPAPQSAAPEPVHMMKAPKPYRVAEQKTPVRSQSTDASDHTLAALEEESA
ncbi:hypothetical protein CERSUDRAFT_93430 [Gelatoporia subvermispora B]|uniref:Uncharacterized protein n=1 Tax=Ceriporiopsis subvermispora (strain B) TaxID=914234 RepID=M2QQP7_CERS8|nr:hypothetical protein CERSUDRAFT_93430 [Gelatoporia subvermispora B]